MQCSTESHFLRLYHGAPHVMSSASHKYGVQGVALAEIWSTEGWMKVGYCGWMKAGKARAGLS